MKVTAGAHLCCLQATASAVAWSWEASRDLVVPGVYSSLRPNPVIAFPSAFAAAEVDLWCLLCLRSVVWWLSPQGEVRHRVAQGVPPLSTPSWPGHTWGFPWGAQSGFLRKAWATERALLKVSIFLTVYTIDMDKEAKKDQCGVVSAGWGGGRANIKRIWPNLGAVYNYGLT